MAPIAPLPGPGAGSPALQLKVDLRGIGRSVWRRVVVPGGFTFAHLHEVIQCVMPWGDEHLHEFTTAPPGPGRGRRQRDLELHIGRPNEMDFTTVADESRVRLDQVLKVEGDRVRYTYDFGDCWEHVVVVEEVLAAEPGALPRCVGASGRAPEEDSRGSGRRRAGPARLDVTKVDAALDGMRRAWAKSAVARLATPAPPSVFAWVQGEEIGSCVACGGALEDDAFLLDILGAGSARPAWFEGFACKACEARGAWFEHFVDWLDIADTSLGDVEAFEWRGVRLEVVLAVTRDGKPAPRTIPWAQVQVSAQGPDESADVATLPRVDRSWELLVHPAAWVMDGRSGPSLAYALVVADEEGRVRAAQIGGERMPLVDVLVDAVRHAAAAPSLPCAPARPARLVASEALAARLKPLAEALSRWGIETSLGPTPQAREAAASISEHVGQDAPAWLHLEPEETLASFAAAAETFLAAQPWRRVRPDTLIEATIRSEGCSSR